MSALIPLTPTSDPRVEETIALLVERPHLMRLSAPHDPTQVAIFVAHPGLSGERAQRYLQEQLDEIDSSWREYLSERGPITHPYRQAVLVDGPWAGGLQKTVRAISPGQLELTLYADEALDTEDGRHVREVWHYRLTGFETLDGETMAQFSHSGGGWEPV